MRRKIRAGHKMSIGSKQKQDFRLYGVCSSQTMNSLDTITFAWALRENVCKGSMRMFDKKF